MIWPAGSGRGPDRLDRRATHPGGPTLVASPRRVALHAQQRDGPRQVTTDALVGGSRLCMVRVATGPEGATSRRHYQRSNSALHALSPNRAMTSAYSVVR